MGVVDHHRPRSPIDMESHRRGVTRQSQSPSRSRLSTRERNSVWPPTLLAPKWPAVPAHSTAGRPATRRKATAPSGSHTRPDAMKAVRPPDKERRDGDDRGTPEGGDSRRGETQEKAPRRSTGEPDAQRRRRAGRVGAHVVLPVDEIRTASWFGCRVVGRSGPVGNRVKELQTGRRARTTLS